MKHISSLSTADRVTGNKNEPITKGEKVGFVFCFYVPEAARRSRNAVRGYHPFC